MSEFLKFTSIELFHNLIKSARQYPAQYAARVTYKSKVKLHGTNAGVIVKNGVVSAQKRTGLITPDKDNFGFAKWVEKNAHYFSGMADCHIYGEWYGSGIQKNVAVAELKEKRFAIFDIFSPTVGGHIICPASILQVIYASGPKTDFNTFIAAAELDGIDIIPWYEDAVLSVNLFDDDDCRRFIGEEETKVQRVDKECPFMKSHFGISGIGEGLVYYPIVGVYNNGAPIGQNNPIAPIPDGDLRRYIFKAKGQSHEKAPKKERTALQLSPEQIKTQNEFVERFVTEERLESVVRDYCDNCRDMKGLGKFLKEFCLDVQREARAELEESGLEWKSVIKPVQDSARNWFILQTKVI